MKLRNLPMVCRKERLTRRTYTDGGQQAAVSARQVYPANRFKVGMEVAGINVSRQSRPRVVRLAHGTALSAASMAARADG